MRCDKCQSKEAAVHVTRTDDVHITATNLCPDCFHNSCPVGVALELWLGSIPSKFCNSDAFFRTELIGSRWFPEDCYDFVVEALSRAHNLAENASSDPEFMHTSARQLLNAIRTLAIQRWGKDAKAQLAQWGVLRTEDIGEIVYNMVGTGYWAVSETDKPEDFANGYDFAKAFPEE